MDTLRFYYRYLKGVVRYARAKCPWCGTIGKTGCMVCQSLPNRVVHPEWDIPPDTWRIIWERFVTKATHSWKNGS